MYPLSGIWSAPTTESATWCLTPAAASAARMLRVDVSKNSSTALSSHDGAFVTSTTTSAPASAWPSPSPVMVLTPDEGEADTASWLRPRRRGISFLPMSPLPPMTTIFMLDLPVCRQNRAIGMTEPIRLRSTTYGIARRASVLPRFGYSDLLRVPRVQYHRDEAGLHLTWVPRHPVQAPGRLVERLARLDHLGRLVVDPQFVLAFHHVPDRRPGVALRYA